MSEQDLEVWTIGHSNVEAAALVELLVKHGIGVVVDVRSVPYSQYTAQFNREAFAQTLNAVGIEYKFAGDYLGGRPSDPTCYKRGVLPDGKANYLEEVDYDAVMLRPWYQRGVDRLLAIAVQQRTVMMCSEEDPARCHRQHLIVETLLPRGVTVWHIRAQGELQRARTRAEELADQPQQLSLL